MESRFKFLGNVGQVIGGSATFAAPTFNQTNHVTLSAEAPDDRPLLLRQRFNIGRRVERIAAAEGVETAAIYRVLLEDYGGQIPSDISRAHYRSIVRDLDEWLDHLNGPNIRPASRSGQRQLPDCRQSSGTACHMLLFAQFAIILTLFASVVLAAWLLQPNPPAVCRWSGKEFSVGSLATMATSDVYECMTESAGDPYWAPARNLGGAGIPRG
ncbi:hypothetical protein [Cupriavidus nantongensis]|uniref:hypothetical protein n=1 Tax=Cupriavidus nantongensis TaxID=1796606 RepID=UPI00358EB080